VLGGLAPSLPDTANTYWKVIALDLQTIQVCDASGNTSTMQVHGTPPA
jgi:hypothetical protein